MMRVADLRPEHAETMPGERDRLGRLAPHRMGGLTYATLAARVGVGVKEVPGDFWSLDVTEDGFPCAVVACPCGMSPQVEPLGPNVPCECERNFFFDGDTVWAFNTPASPPGATA